jgi:hypothetical protein
MYSFKQKPNQTYFTTQLNDTLGYATFFGSFKQAWLILASSPLKVSEFTSDILHATKIQLS